MIILDIETTGIYFKKNGIWQIGAIELNTMEEFLEECKIDQEDEINQKALEITGKTKEYLRQETKITQKDLIEKFFNWLKKFKVKNCVCQNPQFDLGFIFTKAKKYNIKCPIPYRAFDTHSIAQLKYYQLNKEFLLKDNKESDMNLSNVLKFCNLKDTRKNHNALEDCKLTGECFSRLVYGKNLFSEFKEFDIPDYLKQKNDNL